jgi:hypothetical protein
MTIGDKGTLDIESTSGATLHGIAVDMDKHGNIEIGATTASGSILMLDDGATITGGTLTIENSSSVLDIEAKIGATLHGVDVVNTAGGNINIDPGKATLTADDGTTFTGGTMTIGGKGMFDVDSGETGNGATLDNVDIANCGIVQVEDGAVLHLKGVTIAGGILNTVGDPYDNGGVIQVLATDGKSIFDGSANTVTVEGYVQVEPNAQLELKGDIDLAGGIIELDESDTGHHGSQLVIDGHVTLTGYGYVALEGNDTGIVGGGGESTATLDNESYIYGSRGGYIGTGDDSLIFINSGTVNSEAGHAGPLVIDTGDHAVINTGILEATGFSELDLYGTYENCGGTIGAYSDDVGPSVVKLFDATIKGGTLATDSAVPGGSMIEIVAINSDDVNMSVFDGSHDHAVTVDGYVRVDAGANLELIGTIHNEGTIDVDGKQTDLVIDGSVTLDGKGTITLDNANHPADQIVGGGDDGNTLYNVDNTISGAGNIGADDGNLSLVNEHFGTIDANLSGQTLTLDTGGNQITNAGTFAAGNGGILDVDSSVNNACGSIKVFDGSVADFAKSVSGGTAMIEGGKLEFDAAASVAVTFDNGAGGNNYGELVLDDWKDFSGTISGFSGHDSESPSLANTDEIDLVGFKNGRIIDTVTSGEIVTLTLEDKAGDTIDFSFDDPSGTLKVKSDGHNGTIIYDPPAASSPSPSVSIGGVGNDTFTFTPGVGAETINNFNPQVDTIELAHFANVQNVQQLAAAITPDAHGDAVLELGHNDSIAIPGMTPSYLQAHLQSLVHLH